MNFFLFLGVLVVFLVLFKNFVDFIFRRRVEKYAYIKKEYLMTQPERDCFNLLIKLFGETYWVFPQIHYSAILEHKIRGQNWNGAFWHVNGKSVDFVLCDKERISPKLAIELDDWSHEREDRQEKDQEENRIFKESTLPLLRITHEDINNPEIVLQKINVALSPPVNHEPAEELKWYQKLLKLLADV